MKLNRQQKILEQLEKSYQGTTTALKFRNPFELLIATMLSAQCTDTQVNKVTAGLFAKHPDPRSLAELSEEELAAEIKGCGLYRSKARNIRTAVRLLLEQYGGEVPSDRDDLMKLPGVGRKTANVVAANAFGQAALGVDTHVYRVANRLGLSNGKTPKQVEDQLTSIIPREKWAEAHHWLIWHGRKVCRARGPKCEICPVNNWCAKEVP